MTAKPPLLGTAREWAVDLGVATAVGVFFGLVGPFGSYFNGPPASRVLHFVVCFWVGGLIFGTLIRLSLAGARRVNAPVWLTLTVAVLAGGGLLSVFVGWLGALLWPVLKGVLTPVDWYSQSLVLSAPVLTFMVVRRVLRKPVPPPPVPSEIGVAPVDLAPDVLCLRMEDHYVRVHTQAGSRLVEGPFERVIAGLGGVEGMRVHRSWWVARAAVVGVVADGRNLRLALRGDLSAPVSRASVARLREAGWLGAEG